MLHKLGKNTCLKFTSYFHGWQSANSSWLLPSKEGAGLSSDDPDHGNEETFGWKWEGKKVEGDKEIGVAVVRKTGL